MAEDNAAEFTEVPAALRRHRLRGATAALVGPSGRPSRHSNKAVGAWDGEGLSSCDSAALIAS